MINQNNPLDHRPDRDEGEPDDQQQRDESASASP
jgi:hypothetical protein